MHSAAVEMGGFAYSELCVLPAFQSEDIPVHTADDRLLSSLDIVTIVGKFNDEFDVEISVEDLEPENFNSVDAMVELITRMQE